VYITNQANSHPKTRQVTVVSPEESTLKTRPTHPLKQNRPHLHHQKRAHSKPGQLTFCKRMAREFIFRRVHSKRMLSPSKKQIARVCALDVFRKKCKKAYSLKQVQAHCDHRNSVRKKVKPRNQSPKEIMVNRGATYSLRNSQFRRDLSQNTDISEIL
jgi:hypothetical protein